MWFTFVQCIITTQYTIFVFYAPSTILKYSNIHKIINLYPISKIIREKDIQSIGDNETTLKQYLNKHGAQGNWENRFRNKTLKMV